MHRFYYPSKEFESDVILLPEEESYHALKVLRLHENEEVTVLNGNGQIVVGKLKVLNKFQAAVTINLLKKVPPPRIKIHLFQAILKSKSWELLIQKSVELGVSTITPIITQNVVPEIKSEAINTKIARWKSIAVSALKQSGNAWLPEIYHPIDIYSSVKQWRDMNRSFSDILDFVATLDPSAKPLKTYLRTASLPCSSNYNIGLWIGPEGDFTNKEICFLLENNILPVRLCSNILRSETAAIVAVAILQYELG